MSKIVELRLRNVPKEVILYYDKQAEISDVSRNELIIDDLIELSKKSVKDEVHQEYNYYLSKILEIIEELSTKVSTIDELSFLLERINNENKENHDI